ncbi:AAA family ATPase [Bradyrhizobium sp. INPA03-11B]|uniref:AAA family ATPase n=1 Tax=Bradyrhizobium sp. INPA03-11B TaxID=418598 RepID=UPI00338F0B42
MVSASLRAPPPSRRRVPHGWSYKSRPLCNVDLLEEMAKRIGTVRLIVVDPTSAYTSGSDGNGNGNVETREVLEPLADMANRLRIAVVAVTHLNKGGGGDNRSALNRLLARSRSWLRLALRLL